MEVFAGDLTVPASLDPALRDVDAVLLIWTAPPQTAPAVLDRLAARTRRLGFLSAPHRTDHPFFRQPNPMATTYAEVERIVVASRLESTIIRPGMFASNALLEWATTIRTGGVVRWPDGCAETAPVDDRDVAAVHELTPDESARRTAATWPRPAVEMLLAAWNATMGVPPYITTAASDIVGSPPRTIAQWATDHAEGFGATTS